jgi:hypothetical protein
MLTATLFRQPRSALVAIPVALAIGAFLYNDYRRHTTLKLDCDPRHEVKPFLASSGPFADVEEGDAIEDTPEQDEEEVPDDDSEYEYPNDPSEDFQDVLSKINLQSLASAATALRIGQQLRQYNQSAAQKDLLEASCTVSKTMYGGYNVCYEITFKDGLKWIARVPGHGFRFVDLDVQKMNSEYHTMRHIKNNIEFPMPEVIFWTTSPDLIGTPYGIISAAEGHPLSLEWNAMPQEKRFAVLTDIAGHMSRLQKLSFAKIGSLDFTKDGQQFTVGPNLQLKPSVLGMIENNTLTIDTDAWPPTIASGPYDSTLGAFHDRIKQFLDPALSTRLHAYEPITRILLDTMPKELVNEQRFYFNKPDFALQNIFVDDNGKVTSFIDWDRVSCESSFNGYAALPFWLCLDWNPNLYDHEAGCPEGRYNDPSPKELRQCRAHYSQALADCMKENGAYDPRMTELSFVAWAIDQAVNDQHDRGGIFVNFFEKAKVPFKMFEYCTDFVEDNTNLKNDILRVCFSHAWEAGWESADDSLEEDLKEVESSEEGDSPEGSGVLVDPEDVDDGGEEGKMEE